MIGIKGVGGIGKSTLASKIFEEEITLDPSLGDDEDLFPKRFWWEAGNLGGFSGLARQFLTDFGYPVPKEEIDLQEALIRQLQRHRHLIIIDNLESLLGEDGSWNNEFYQQFFTAWIEKGDTSKIIVTTREKPKTRGFNRWIELKGLKPPEGAQLLAESQITGDLENFSRRVDGHPLLLRLVADLILAEFPQNPSLERLADLGLGNLSQLLSDPQVVGSHRQETVGIALVLDASFQRLSQRQQELFTKTSIYRREFDSPAAKAVMDNYPEIALSEITADLRELQRRSLLEEKEENRQRIFSFQPLVWEYAQYKAGDQRELHQKAIAYYLSTIKTKPWQTLKDVTEYLEIFYHWSQLKVYDSAFDILRAIDDFLTRRGYYQTLADYYLELVTVYQQQQEQTNWNYAASLSSLGNAYYFLGEYQKAIEFHQQSLAITREIGDRGGEAASYNNLANVYDSLGEYQKAIEFHQQSLAIEREIGDRGGEAKSYGNLGNVYQSLGEYQKAIEFYQQSLAIEREIGDRGGEAKSYMGLGIVYGSLGEYQKAIEFHQQSLAITREIGDRGGEATSYNNLGNVYYSLGEYQKAIEFHQQSLAIKREIGDRGGEAASYNNLGNVYDSLGEYQKAIEFHQQSLAITRKIGDRGGEAYSYNNLGNVYQSLGEYEKASEFYQQSLAITREIGDRGGEAKSYGNLGNVYYSLGEYQKAIEFHQQSLAITREIGDRGVEAKSWFNLGLTYYKLDRISEAKEAFLQSRELYQALGLAGYVQKCDDEIRQLETRKYPLIVAFFLGVVMFPLVLIGGIIVALWRLLKRWLRKA
ncbi:stress-induced bacterial acidophilic repeat motif family protein [Microcystis aeruginosa TAIHU98]|uniref:Stress-induced bacterial acidophilic repeat motif family protein n=1 Tax=Microcystis aeruginosa TAIHU98 TaxID=1134457 RepID=L7E5E9_MICAE|nr:stress-induced bacterial acidophilic repeat motif family protein [Microcystis aeruginosa TAIHU98]